MSFSFKIAEYKVGFTLEVYESNGCEIVRPVIDAKESMEHAVSTANKFRAILDGVDHAIVFEGLYFNLEGIANALIFNITIDSQKDLNLLKLKSPSDWEILKEAKSQYEDIKVTKKDIMDTWTYYSRQSLVNECQCIDEENV